MAFETIDYAEPNWDKVFNKNLAKTTELEDTGWIKTSVLAPVTGNVEFRRLNNILFLRGSVSPNASGNVKVANIPLISGVHFVINDANLDNAAGAEIDANRDLYLKQVPSANITHTFSILANFFNGPENSLVGGVNPS